MGDYCWCLFAVLYSQLWKETMTKQVLDESRRLRGLMKVRPASLQMFLLGMFRKQERRTIISTKVGIEMYVDPLSALGNFLISTGEYEREMCELVSEFLPVGGTFVDIGGNEGYISCVAGKQAGPDGLVLLVEPQTRLEDVIRINLALNKIHNCQIILAALSDAPSATISLWPSNNTGATSIVRPYRWGAEQQVVETISFSTLLDNNSVQYVDLVKVDVEGYEKEVIESLAPAIMAKRVGSILLEYHESVLKDRGLNWYTLDGQLLDVGMERILDHRLQFTGDGLAGYRMKI